jgi:hypothetical protein
VQAAKEETGIEKKEVELSRRGKEVRTSNKYLALCVFWAIMGERLHFGIRNSDFEEGKSNQAPNPSEVETVVSR